MKNINILKISLVVLVFISGCNPLKKMIKLSEQQQINVNPDPILMIGGNVVFNISESILNISFGIFLVFVSINMFLTSK